MPERWLKNDENYQEDMHRYVSLPFGYGRRTCIGRRFAEAELAILLAKVNIKQTGEHRTHNEMKFKFLFDLLFFHTIVMSRIFFVP